MKISGFSFARNAQKLYYPIAESIRSILPLCDEFVIAIGKGDDDDHTRDLVLGIGDPRIRIIDTIWDEKEKLSGHVFAQQTTLALNECSGDWCFYLQCDEVVHEKDLPGIKGRLEDLGDESDVQGLLFNYYHFWGDYDHHQVNHRWYPLEIRVIRGGQGIESWGDAQSFRKNGSKIRVAPSRAHIYHYGWARPPRLMQRKRHEFYKTYWGRNRADTFFETASKEFDYGSLERVARFKGSHPAAMKDFISKMDWKECLQYAGKSAVIHDHDRLKYRVLTLIEQKVLGGRQLGGFHNYVLVKK